MSYQQPDEARPAWMAERENEDLKAEVAALKVSRDIQDEAIHALVECHTDQLNKIREVLGLPECEAIELPSRIAALKAEVADLQKDSLIAYLSRQRPWSEKTFGSGKR